MPKFALLFVVALIPLLSEANSPRPRTAVGGTSDQGAQVLWNEGRAAFGRGENEAAALLFKRLLDRYPGTSFRDEVLALYGVTLNRLDRSQDAISPLTQFIENNGTKNDGYRARLELGRAYLNTGKFHEAALVAVEISEAPRALPGGLKLDGLLLKAQAQFSLGRDLATLRTLDSFSLAAKRPAIKSLQEYPSLMTQAAFIKMKLKIRSCPKVDSTTPISETQLSTEMDLMAVCLLEGLVLFKKAVDQGDHYWLDRAVTTIGREFANFSDLCRKPPPKAGRLSEKERKIQQKEAVQLLSGSCQAHRQQARDLVQGWKEKTAQKLHYHLTELNEYL